MKCPVCHASSKDASTCPQCGNDPAAIGSDLSKIMYARERFKQQASAYEPEKRVRMLDRFRPWMALVLGFALFVLWLRACATMGTF
jgi:hypothetical protein